MYNQVGLGANLTDAVVCLTNVQALVTEHDILDDQALVFFEYVSAANGHLSVVFGPQNLRCWIAADRTQKLDSLALKHGEVCRFFDEIWRYCNGKREENSQLTRGKAKNVNTKIPN
jgi:hypothetical protein